jgi:hypothetical protein
MVPQQRRSARAAHRLLAARNHLAEATRELEQVREMAEAGDDWHGQLEAAMSHLRHLDGVVADAERQVPGYEDGQGWGR